jgi:tetratricopeptide (TPR) repeat protein
LIAVATVQGWSAVGISFMAVGIAVFGVRERGIDRVHQARARLGALVDDLSALTVEQARFGAEGKMTAELLNNFDRRRLVLCHEGLTVLFDGLQGQASSHQHVLLALHFARLGEIEVADDLFLRAVGAAGYPSVRAFALREYAYALFFVFGRLDEGRAYFKRAVEAHHGRDDDPALLHLLDTYLLWARAEAEVITEPAVARVEELLADASETAERIRTIPRLRAARRRIADLAAELKIAEAK